MWSETPGNELLTSVTQMCVLSGAAWPPSLVRHMLTMALSACMQALSMVFVDRACRYLSSQMAHLGDAVLANLSKQQGSVHCSMPDHQNIRHRTRLLHPLLQV